MKFPWKLKRKYFSFQNLVFGLQSTFRRRPHRSSSPGEVERLLREYRQNQELVRKIGGVSYQIIYPVQMRHHEKVGISTREVGGSKVRYSLGRRNVKNSNNPATVCHQFHHLIPPIHI